MSQEFHNQIRLSLKHGQRSDIRTRQRQRQGAIAESKGIAPIVFEGVRSIASFGHVFQ